MTLNSSQTPTSSTENSSQARPISSRRSKLWILIPAAALLASAVPLYPMVRDQLRGDEGDYTHLATETVKRGSFRISVTERGALSSSKNSTLSSGVEGTTTIIGIIEEGASVRGPVLANVDGTIEEIGPKVDDQQYVTIRTKDGSQIDQSIPMGTYTRVVVKEGQEVKAGDTLAGDVCCELDAATLEQELIQQQILVTNALAAVNEASKAVDIQKLQNQTDQASAHLVLTLAELDLEKFKEGEQAQLEFEAEVLLKTAEAQLAQAQEQYEFSKRNAKKGFQSQNQLESARIAMDNARLQVEIEKGKLNVLRNFTNRRTLTELRQLAEDAAREIERVRQAGEAALAQLEAKLAAAQLTLDAEQQKLARLERQVRACKLIAPQDGKVVYANQSSRRSEPVVIEEGATIRERQAIIHLPDFSQMKVDVKIHESKISPVRAGQIARIKVDALPNRTFRGVVSAIPDVPVPGDWPNTDLMLYPVEVKIQDDVKDLKPGMTADVQIIVDDREDVLQVPVQAIVAVGERYVAWVLTPRGPSVRDDVKIGKSNDSMIEILSGLEEGDRVVMNPRSQFGDQLSELEAKYGKAQQQPGEAPPAEGGPPEAGAEGPQAGQSGQQGPRGPRGEGGQGPRGPREGGGGPGGAAGGPGGGGGFAGGRPSAESIMQRLDKNSDGKITKDEIPADSPFPLERNDANKDGEITLDELKQAMSRFSGGGGPR